MTMESRIVEVAGKLDMLHRLRSLSQTEDWKALRLTIAEAVQRRISRVIDPDCSEKDTTIARAEIRAWTWVMRAADVTEADVAAGRKELEGLRKAWERRHDLGLETSSPDFETRMSKLESLLQRTEQR